MNYDEFCFWFSVFDIFFLPYFKWFSISFSVPFIALWMLMNKDSAFEKSDGAVLKCMMVAMFASVAISIVYPFELRTATTFSTTIKRTAQYIIIVGYYLFYLNYFKKHYVSLNKALCFLIAYMVGLALLYHIIPNQYAAIKLFLYPADNHTRRFLNNEIEYRFNSILVDPNNVAYLADGAMAWILLRTDIKTKGKFMALAGTLFIVLSTASSGGIFAYACVMAMLILKSMRPRMPKVSRESAFILFAFAVCFLVLLVQESTREVIYNNLLVPLQLRFEHYLTRGDMSGGRLSDLFSSLKHLNPIMSVVGSGKEGISYEIGHLYYIGMYGVPAYIEFMWISFRKARVQKRSDLIWMFPFFLGFTINIAIGEFKWLAAYYLLLAYSRSGLNTSERRPKKIANLQRV